MASFLTMGGAGSSGQVEYSIDHNVQGYSYCADYTQSPSSISAPCSSPGLYILGLMYPASKTIQNLSWGGIVLQERTIDLSNSEKLKIALVVVSNSSPNVSYTGGYAVPVIFSYFLAPYDPSINYQQLYNNNKIKYTLDDIEYSFKTSIPKSSAPLSLPLGNAGMYHLMIITAVNNTGSGHVHYLSATNGTVDSFREYYFASSNRHTGMSIGIIDGENNCNAVFYASMSDSYSGALLFIWIKKKS